MASTLLMRFGAQFLTWPSLERTQLHSFQYLFLLGFSIPDFHLVWIPCQSSQLTRYYYMDIKYNKSYTARFLSLT